MQRSPVVVLVLVLCGCYDLTLPPPAIGRVTGIVLVSNNTGFETPAAGVVVSVRQSSMSVTTNTEGFFEISPIPFAHGFLDLQLDENGDGIMDRWRVISFDDRGIRPGQDSNLGTISLRDGATIVGRVLLEGAEATGHGNTAIYVPGMPAATYTFPTGDFTLTQLPEGPITLAAFHAGYALKTFQPIELRAGELMNLTAQTLQRSDGGTDTTGAVTGTVQLIPAGDLSSVSIVIPGTAQAPIAVASDGTFDGQFPAGMRTLLFRAPGYSDFAMANVAILPGSTRSLGTVMLAGGSSTYMPNPIQPPDSGITLAGCGDGTVTAGEACDDMNRVSGDGCSPTCELEIQPGGGEWCTDATPLKLVSIGNGNWGARAAGSEPRLLQYPLSSCASPNGSHVDAVYEVTLTERSSLAASLITGGAAIAILPAQCGGVELACGRTIAHAPSLPAGAYQVVLFLVQSSQSYQIDLVVGPPTSEPFCGDGIISVNEECDDGNARANDGCYQCQLQMHLASSSCVEAPDALFFNSTPTTRVARFSEYGGRLGFDPALTPSCASPGLDGGGTFTNALRVTLPARGTLTVAATNNAGNVLNDLSIGVREDATRTCAGLELACENALPAAGSLDTETLTLKHLDAGTYLIVVQSSTVGQLSFIGRVLSEDE